MKIPISERKKALIVVDVQPSFLDKRNDYIVGNILKLLASVKYDLYIEATFHAEKGSVWDIQEQWICPEGEKTQTIKILSSELDKFRAIKIKKQTKSVFKGDRDLSGIFKKSDIKEIHIVGLDTDDCVLSTAFESFDMGFITYAIEECCESSTSEALHKHGLAILRTEDMTNNSCSEEINFAEVN